MHVHTQAHTEYIHTKDIMAHRQTAPRRHLYVCTEYTGSVLAAALLSPWLPGAEARSFERRL